MIAKVNLADVHCVCPKCDELKILTVDSDKLKNWLFNKIPIQEVFPDMSRDDRERLQSGTCPKCWDEMFS